MILVVDDEPDVVNFLKIRLESCGFGITRGYNGEEALRLTEEVMPDLIILDVMMPEPNGFVVCKRLKDNPKYKHIPIVLLTAKITESDKFWGQEAGADAYITKPYNPEELMSTITTLLS